MKTADQLADEIVTLVQGHEVPPKSAVRDLLTKWLRESVEQATRTLDGCTCGGHGDRYEG